MSERQQFKTRTSKYNMNLQRWVSTKSSISQLECIFIFYKTPYGTGATWSYYTRAAARCALTLLLLLLLAGTWKCRNQSSFSSFSDAFNDKGGKLLSFFFSLKHTALLNEPQNPSLYKLQVNLSPKRVSSSGGLIPKLSERCLFYLLLHDSSPCVSRPWDFSSGGTTAVYDAVFLFSSPNRFLGEGNSEKKKKNLCTSVVTRVRRHFFFDRPLDGR